MGVIRLNLEDNGEMHHPHSSIRVITGIITGIVSKGRERINSGETCLPATRICV